MIPQILDEKEYENQRYGNKRFDHMLIQVFALFTAWNNGTECAAIV
jgi:hypothetical protein